MNTRRAFVKNSALAMFGVGNAPGWLARAAESAGSRGRKKVLVTIFQRGAADGLNVVVPCADPSYYKLRPSIAIPRPDLLELDGFFGLHPALKPLHGIYRSGHLAVVEAVGSPDPTRSHFDAQDYMESGTPGRKSTRDGWLNRALDSAGRNASPVQAVSLGANLPRTLRGANPAVAVGSLSDFQVQDAKSAATFEGMYSNALDRVLRGTGGETFDAVRLLQSVRKQRYETSPGVTYPAGRFGQSLQQIARIIKADVGLEVAFAEMGGWDTHVNEVAARPTAGQLANLLTEFGAGLAAFYHDLGDGMEDVVLVTMSEFGRTARENGNRGTDHGHANLMFVMGGGVNGGKVHGEWPGLAPEQLHEGRDLALTTDYRTVLCEVLQGHLATKNVRAVFPGFIPGPPRQVLKPV